MTKNSKAKPPEADSPEKKINKPKPKDTPSKKADPKDTKNDNGDADMNDLKDRLEAEKDRVLRLSAEFENYKKRKQRELDDFKKFANESIFKQLLPVIDNLERAMDSARENPDDGSLLEGVELTHRDIIKLMETFNVSVVQADGEPFDPNFHQAVTQVETDEHPDNTVTAVLQKGYLFHDRLIRPAMVVVSKNNAGTDNEKSQK